MAWCPFVLLQRGAYTTNAVGFFTESCKPDYAVSGPLVVMDNMLSVSSILDVAHDKGSARLQPVDVNVPVSCWKPLSSDTSQYIQVRGVYGRYIQVCSMTDYIDRFNICSITPVNLCVKIPQEIEQ